MCGIAGIWRADELVPHDLSQLFGRAQRIRHRGPEQIGSWSNGRVAMVHNRLILRDPQLGQQPMVSAAGTVLAYNGELFNHNELKAELIARGHSFRSDSDTEVILHAYDAWGEVAWKRLNGMFAIVLYDDRQACLYLVRDALGMKPLYYRLDGGNIDFASEPHALSEHFSPHFPGVIHYLRTARCVDGSQTLISGASVVEPGTFVKITSASQESLRWTEQALPLTAEKSEHEQKAQIRFLLERSVGNQSDCDYPFGLCLSGGVDSAILCSLLRNQGRSFTAYSIAIENDTDDLDAARAFAATKRVPFKGAMISHARFFASMRELIALRKLPLCFTNDILIFELARAASTDVKILLSGEGADELFGGYSKLLEPITAYAEAQRSPMRNLRLNALKATYPEADLNSSASFMESLMTWWQPSDLSACLKSPWREQVKARTAATAEPAASDSRNDPFSSLMSVHLPNLLNRLDSSMMAASVEGRMPFTDIHLVRFVADQRSCDPLHPKWQNKALLKSAFIDCLSKDLLTKPKRPFDANLSILMAGKEGQFESAQINRSDVLSLLFDMDELRKWRARNDNSRTLHLVWQLINLNVWLEQNSSFI